MSTVVMLLLVFLYTNCTDKWDEHTKVNNDVNRVSIFEFLESNSNYSKFTQLVKETGVDELLNSPVVYTLFAPTNAAIDALPENVLKSSDDKELFVKQHIHNRKIVAETNGEKQIRIAMLNSKKIELDFDKKTVDDISLSGKETLVKNGVIYSIEESLIPRISIWEYLDGNSQNNDQIAFINSLSKLTFDPEISNEIGYDEKGNTVYDSIFVYKNEFNLDIADLSSEDSTYTFFIISNESLDEEFRKFQKYFRRYNESRDEPDIRDSIVIYKELLQDYLFTSAYNIGEIPAQAISMNGIEISLNEADITSTIKASNGYIHFIQDISLELTDKIKEIKIEAEQLGRYFGIGKDLGAAQGYLRSNPKASGGMDFVLDNHSAGALVHGLILDGGIIPSIRYKVYWRAVNDFRGSMRNPNDDMVISQRINGIRVAAFDDDGNALELTAQNIGAINTEPIEVELTEYSDNPEDDEVFIGNYNNLRYEQKYFQLLPTANRMAVTLDYIRFVPDFN